MRIPLTFLAVVIGVMALIDWRIFAIVRKRISPAAAKIHLVLAALVWCVLIAAVCLPRRTGSDETLITVMWMLFGVATVIASKLLFVIVDILACLPGIWHHRRWRPVTWFAVAISLLLFGGMWWGALVNRFNIQVREVEIDVPGLPSEFDGFTIAQFSDIHVGTFDTDTTFISKLVDRINGLNADAIMFTGDIVNRRSEEVIPFIKPLSRLHASHGVFSILGNHDYGDYYTWDSELEKKESFNMLREAQKKMGWRLLLDEHAFIRLAADSIAIVGVENIGDPPFPSYGSLPRATEGLNPGVTKILLSHNPAHWANEILPDSLQNITLTLSGHTHAMQIELLGFSPAVWRYPRWGGLYDDNSGKRKLYVNIGAGTVGMPMRLGATPEITLFTLRKASNAATKP